MLKRKFIFVILVIVPLIVISCSKKNIEEPNQEEPNQEEPNQEEPYQTGYAQTFVYGGLPKNLIFLGTKSIFPYMVLDKNKLNNDGEIIELGSLPLKTHSYLYYFLNYFIQIDDMEGSPTFLSYSKSNKMAYENDSFAEVSKKTIFSYYSFGFEKNGFKPIFGRKKISDSNIDGEISKKNVFFSEFFTCNYYVSKDDNSNVELSNNAACVASVYWGKYAKLIIETDLDKQDVWEAYMERLGDKKSQKWMRIISNSYVYVETRPGGSGENETDIFFSLIENKDYISKPIFFSIEN